MCYHVQVLEAMNPWCVKQHGQSGLTEACRQSKVSQKRNARSYNSDGILAILAGNG